MSDGSSSSSQSTPETLYSSTMGSNLFINTMMANATEKSRRDIRPTSRASVREWDRQSATVSEGHEVDGRNLRAARDLHAGRAIEREDETGQEGRDGPTVAWLDRWATTYVPKCYIKRRANLRAHSISKSLGIVSAILFILGNVLVFYPFPTSRITCYHSSPMLWWGVIAVTGVGWFLLLQVFFVVVVVGIGGLAVVVSGILQSMSHARADSYLGSPAPRRTSSTTPHPR